MSGARAALARTCAVAALATAGALAFAAAVGAATPARPTSIAAQAVAPIDRILLEAESPADLRADFVAYAATTERTAPDEAARAWRLAARSWERAGQRDSAIAAVRKAMALRQDPADHVALADLLLRRRAGGDVDEAIGLLAVARRAGQEDRGAVANTHGLLAWAHSLAGRRDTAYTVLRPFATVLGREPEWRYRVAKILIGVGRYEQALQVARPLAREGRLQDLEVSALLSEIAATGGAGGHVAQSVEKEILDADREELAALAGIGAKRVRFPSIDGFGLGAVVVPPASAPASGRVSPRPAVVILAHPRDPATAYDSLLFGLRAAGVPAILLDVRGSGWSVAASCPAMDTWQGREERLAALVVRDTRVALRRLAESTPIDTSRYVVMGVRASSPLAAEAAAHDPGVVALVLASPRGEPVERGPMRARIAARKLPLFIEQSPEDRYDPELPDALYQASDRAASRVTEGQGAAGAAVFRADPDEVARLSEWLAKLPSRAPRPTSRR